MENSLSPAHLSSSKSRLRLWIRLLDTTRFMESAIRERLANEFQSTLPRFDVLAALHRYSDGLKMSELSGVLKVSNGNVTGLVDRLVQDDLVTRMPVEGDRRAHKVRLTRMGIKAFEEMAQAHETWVNDMLSSIDEPEINDLTKTLAGLVGIKGGFEHERT